MQITMPELSLAEFLQVKNLLGNAVNALESSGAKSERPEIRIPVDTLTHIDLKSAAKKFHALKLK